MAEDCCLFPVLHDYVTVRVCNLHNPHHEGHTEKHKQQTADSQSVALFPSHLVLRLTNTGWMVVCTFRLRSLSCFLTISAAICFLNGKPLESCHLSLEMVIKAAVGPNLRVN